MKKHRLDFLGYAVEFTLDPLQDNEEPNFSLPSTVADMACRKIEEGGLSGVFSDMPDDTMRRGLVAGHKRSGSWRVIELDYEKISRILAWEYGFTPDEQLSEELFARYYGQNMGRHYFEKWLHYNRNIHDMLAYFHSNRRDGQQFCDMIIEQKNKFEERKRKEMYDKRQ